MVKKPEFLQLKLSDKLKKMSIFALEKNAQLSIEKVFLLHKKKLQCI